MPRPDDLVGAVPIAYIVIRSEACFDQKHVLRTLRSQIPGTHIPVDFIQVSSIPRTGSGKIIRQELNKLSVK